MNRETLIHSMNNITSDAIFEFFDQLMAVCCLYNVFGYDDVSVTCNDKNSFDISFDNEDIAKEVYQRSNGMNITLYETKYIIDSSYTECNVHIILNTPGKV